MSYNTEDFQDAFSYIPEAGTWFTSFRGNVAFVGCSADINLFDMTYEQAQIDKPVYLAVMASRKQLQPILDNPHLFDPAFVNAVRLLDIQYADVKVKESE